MSLGVEYEFGRNLLVLWKGAAGRSVDNPRGVSEPARPTNRSCYL